LVRLKPDTLHLKPDTTYELKPDITYEDAKKKKPGRHCAVRAWDPLGSVRPDAFTWERSA